MSFNFFSSCRFGGGGGRDSDAHSTQRFGASPPILLLLCPLRVLPTLRAIPPPRLSRSLTLKGFRRGAGRVGLVPRVRSSERACVRACAFSRIEFSSVGDQRRALGRSQCAVALTRQRFATEFPSAASLATLRQPRRARGKSIKLSL